jgi:Cu/Ag efflux pump CusA
MIEKLLAWSIRRRELVALGAIFILIAGGMLLRTMPVDAGIGLPSIVNSAVQTPLYAFARSRYACTTCLQEVWPARIAF